MTFYYMLTIYLSSPDSQLAPRAVLERKHILDRPPAVIADKSHGKRLVPTLDLRTQIQERWSNQWREAGSGGRGDRVL